MKMSRAAVVIGAAVVLVGGGAFAVDAATSDPNTVSLCVNSRTTTVSAPRYGDCVSGDLVELPSGAAVDALRATVASQAGTIGALQASSEAQGQTLTQLAMKVQDQADAIASLQDANPGVVITGSYFAADPGQANLRVRVVGWHLQPGTDILLYPTNRPGTMLDVVPATGRVDLSFNAFCDSVPYKVVVTLDTGSGFTSAPLTGTDAGCP